MKTESRAEGWRELELALEANEVGKDEGEGESAAGIFKLTVETKLRVCGNRGDDRNVIDRTKN
jgi:hypothetical protein